MITPEAVTPEVTKLTGDIWNRMTPIAREQLGVKAKLDAERRGTHWIELFPEEKRALIREFKKEQVAIPKAEAVTPTAPAVEPIPKAEEVNMPMTTEEIQAFPYPMKVLYDTKL